MTSLPRVQEVPFSAEFFLNRHNQLPLCQQCGGPCCRSAPMPGCGSSLRVPEMCADCWSCTQGLPCADSSPFSGKGPRGQRGTATSLGSPSLDLPEPGLDPGLCGCRAGLAPALVISSEPGCSILCTFLAGTVTYVAGDRTGVGPLCQLCVGRGSCALQGAQSRLSVALGAVIPASTAILNSGWEQRTLEPTPWTPWSDRCSVESWLLPWLPHARMGLLCSCCPGQWHCFGACHGTGH